MKMCRIPAEPAQQAKIIEIIRGVGQRIGISNVSESGIGISIEEDEAETIYQHLMEKIRQALKIDQSFNGQPVI